MTELTILTRSLDARAAAKFWLKQTARFAENILTGASGVFDIDRIKYGGHFAVTRSLVAGLKKEPRPLCRWAKKPKLADSNE